MHQKNVPNGLFGSKSRKKLYIFRKPVKKTPNTFAEYFAQCGENRFELIDKAKRDIIAKTDIESSPDEMKVLDSFLFRAWQMGWLGKYDVIVPEQKPADEQFLPLEGLDAIKAK